MMAEACLLPRRTRPMRLRLALAAVMIVAAGGEGWAEPQYRDYPGEPAFHGRAAAPILDTADAKTYRSRLRNGIAQRPNFDGHFSFVTWGCGTGCAMGAVVDQVSGKVTFVPFSMCCADTYFSEPDFDYMKFRADSRMVMFTGKRDEEGPEGRFFYTFEGGSFREIPRTPASSASTPVCRNLTSAGERLACYDKQAGH